MTSMHLKRTAAVATLAATLLVTGGTALASPAPGDLGPAGTTGLMPGPVSEAWQAARNTLANADHQIRRLQEIR